MKIYLSFFKNRIKLFLSNLFIVHKRFSIILICCHDSLHYHQLLPHLIHFIIDYFSFLLRHRRFFCESSSRSLHRQFFRKSSFRLFHRRFFRKSIRSNFHQITFLCFFDQSYFHELTTEVKMHYARYRLPI